MIRLPNDTQFTPGSHPAFNINLSVITLQISAFSATLPCWEISNKILIGTIVPGASLFLSPVKVWDYDNWYIENSPQFSRRTFVKITMLCPKMKLWSLGENIISQLELMEVSTQNYPCYFFTSNYTDETYKKWQLILEKSTIFRPVDHLCCFNCRQHATESPLGTFVCPDSLSFYFVWHVSSQIQLERLLGYIFGQTLCSRWFLAYPRLIIKLISGAFQTDVNVLRTMRASSIMQIAFFIKSMFAIFFKSIQIFRTENWYYCSVAAASFIRPF